MLLPSDPVPNLNDRCQEQCPDLIRETLGVIGAKWAVPILIHLHCAEGPMRYAALQRALHPVTPKELAKRLRELEVAGLVARCVHPTVPPKVDYALTELGRTLYVRLASLAEWAALFGPTVAQNRARGGRSATPSAIATRRGLSGDVVESRRPGEEGR